MTDLSSYRFSILRQGELTLYRGSGACLPSLLLSAPVKDQPPRELVRRLQHEYALRAELHPDWAARPLALTHHRNRVALVLEDPGGEPLDLLLGQPLETTQFLRTAVSLAAAIVRMHERNLIHKDIKPSNFLVDTATGAAWLTGFGIASRLPREHQAPEPPEMIAGSLAYMAPEQTGRMNRSIDSRSDLYALGVTFYEMLTGELPFSATDPMAWVHCHIARQPVAPSERSPATPAQVSSLVMKLLAKNAEDRYQTAVGVVADLQRCLAEWDAHRRIDPFPLGAHDRSDRLIIPEKLYGREPEIATLLASFDRVVHRGTSELVLVSGYSGIGKSSLVNELHKVLVPPRGLFAAGKFDQYKRNVPYATVAQAFQSLVRQVLGTDEAELTRWRGALLQAVGPNGQLMVNLVPQVAAIIGEQPPAPELPPKDQQTRFQTVLRRFVAVFARPEHPLALFLDDLQWLDSATLDLIEHLVGHPEVRHLLLIGAYRDNEVKALHPLARMFARIREAGGAAQQIRLRPLLPDTVQHQLADALHEAPVAVQPLAELVFEKTAGNPFFTIRFVMALVEEALLAFDPRTGVWTWDLPGIRAKGFTDNVADLMAAKLSHLPPTTQKALGYLACIGNAAEIVTLALLLEETEESVREVLLQSARDNLVLRSKHSYGFLHDRIREAAYALVAETERAMVHLRIGRLLTNRTPPAEVEEKIFDIVNQFDAAAALVATDKEREQVAELNLLAGTRAKTATAYAAALRYFEAGRALLSQNGWERHYQLTFDLELNCGECEYLTGEFAVSEKRLSALSARAQTAVDSAAVTCALLNLYINLDHNDRAVEVGLEYLRRVDGELSVRATEEDVRREYGRLRDRLGSGSIEALLDLPLMSDPVRRGTIDVLTAMALPALFTDLHLFRILVFRTVAISLQHGNSDGSTLAYVRLGGILGTHLGDYQAGLRFGRLGLDLVEKRRLARQKARVYFVFAAHVAHWTQDLPTCLAFLRRAFDSAQEAGDYAYASYSCCDIVANRLASGNPLDEVEREAENGLELARKARFGLISDQITGDLRLIRMLRGLTSDFTSFNDADFDERRFEQHLEDNPQLTVAACWYWIRKLQARVHAGDFASAIAAAQKIAPLLWTVPSRFDLADYHFYSALAWAVHCEGASADARAYGLETLAAHHAQIAVWAKNCPSTFANRAALLGAEMARLEGRDLDAMRLYEEAIRLAREHGFIQSEGLAHEVAARFYRLRGLETSEQAHLRSARYCYLRWGAHGKVRQLEQRHPHLREEALPDLRSTIMAPVEHLDLTTVLSVSETVAGELVLERLVDMLMRTAIEHAGAERGLLMLSQAHELRLQAEAITSANTITVRRREAPIAGAAVPESIIQYVARTKESVIIDDALVQGPFSADCYILQRRPRSILCLPLLKQAKLLGMLYLENKLTPHVFNPTRMAILRLLAAQAAMSLENIRLYSDLAEREARIRRLVDSNIIGIIVWNSDGYIIEANDAFLRIVGYGPQDFVSSRVRWAELSPLESRGAEEALKQLAATGTCEPFETEYFRKDGSRVPVLVGAALLEGGSEEGVGFVLSLAERKRAEDNLRDSERRYHEAQMELEHANRVATMGLLTASIAHEIKQPLTAAVTSADAGLRWLGRQPPNVEKARNAFGRIIRDGNRASEVVDRVRALVKKAPPRKDQLDTNQLIRDIVAFTSAETRRNGVALHTQLSADLPLVWADRIQIQQTLLNLVINAIEAMSTSDEESRELRIVTRHASSGVLVEVRDSGPGLDPEALDRIFDAFHTTKSGGMGIGLSICRSIIEAHGGRVWATQNSPRGAIFQFTLPAQSPSES